MIVVYERPPLWDEIAAVFPIVGKPVIFSWGDKIYNPERITITDELHAHERVHGSRQTAVADKIIAWWKRYLVDVPFRLEEEVVAHTAEYRAFKGLDRNARSRYLNWVAGKLASPLYGNILSLSEARRAISS